MNVFDQPLIQACVIRPTFNLMQRAYHDYHHDKAPCKVGYRNQCAIRMSIALERCGFGLDAFPRPSRVHQGRHRTRPDHRKCELMLPHVPGAKELADYLRSLWGEDREFRHKDTLEAQEALRGKRGIIYFNDVFTRSNGSKGDHIDLWDGQHMYNYHLNVDVGGGSGYNEKKFFRKANRIWFFNLY